MLSYETISPEKQKEQKGFDWFMEGVILQSIAGSEKLQDLVLKLKQEVQANKINRETVNIYVYELMLDTQRFKFSSRKVFLLSLSESRYKKAKFSDVERFIRLALEIADTRFKFVITKNLIRETIDMVRSQPEFQLLDEGFNTRSTFLNCQNCILEFTREKIIVHEKTLEMIQKCQFNYMVHANFLEQYIGDKEALQDKMYHFNRYCLSSFGEENWEFRANQLFEIVGYSVSDFESVKKAFFLIGEPNSGKSVLLKWIGKLLGENAEMEGLISAVPLHSFGDKFILAGMCKSKLNINAELSLTPLKDISKFKQVIGGGDYIMIEEKGKNPEIMRTKVKLLFAGNGIPPMYDLDPTKAFYERIHLITFMRSIPKEEQDLDLVDKLWRERDYIFTASMIALHKVFKRKFVFTTHTEDTKYLDNWHLTSNSFVQFFNEKIYESEGGRGISSNEFEQLYHDYCKQNSLSIIPWSHCQMILQGKGYRTEKGRYFGCEDPVQGYKRLVYDKDAPCQKEADQEYHKVYEQTSSKWQAKEAAKEALDKCREQGAGN